MAPPVCHDEPSLALDVTISGYETAPEGHIVYIIHSMKHGFVLATAKHRFSDFVRLHGELPRLPPISATFPVEKRWLKSTLYCAKLDDFLYRRFVLLPLRVELPRLPRRIRLSLIRENDS